MQCIDWINPFECQIKSHCHLLAILGAPHIFHVSRIRVRLAPLLIQLLSPAVNEVIILPKNFLTSRATTSISRTMEIVSSYSLLSNFLLLLLYLFTDLYNCIVTAHNEHNYFNILATCQQKHSLFNTGMSAEYFATRKNAPISFSETNLNRMQSTKLHTNTSYIELQANLFTSIPWRYLWTSTPQTVNLRYVSLCLI